MPKIAKNHNSSKIFQNLPKSESGNHHLTPNQYIKYQGPTYIAQIVFEIF